MSIVVSPTSLETYTDCPRKWWYRYRAKVTATAKAATLYAGIVLHQVFNAVVQSVASGSSCDPVGMFETLWQQAVENNEVRFSSTQSPEGLLASGRRIAELFPDAWKATGLVPIIDADGKPVLERDLRYAIAPGVTVRAILDGLFMSTRDGSVVALDFKNPAQAPDAISTCLSDQLSIQQLVVMSAADSLGIERVDKVAFMVALRRAIPKSSRGKGPEILPPSMVDARTEEQLRETRQRILWMAEDVERGRFPKTPRQPHNTPCDMCDYAYHCAYGTTEGLVFPQTFQLPFAA